MDIIAPSWLEAVFEQSQERHLGLCASAEAFFSIWLKRLRRDLAWTQQTLAEELGVAYSTVQLWERRPASGEPKGLPNPHHLNQLWALDRRTALARHLGGLFQDQRYATYRTPLVELIRAALEAGLDAPAETAATYLVDATESVDTRHPFAGAYQAHFASIAIAITQGQASDKAHEYCCLAERRFAAVAVQVDPWVLEQHRPLLRAIQNEELGFRFEQLRRAAKESPERLHGARAIIERLLALYEADGRQNHIYLQNAFETACAHLGRDDIQRYGVMLVDAIGTDRFNRFFNSLKEVANDRTLLDTILCHSAVKTNGERQDANVLH